MAKAPIFQHQHYKAIAALIAANLVGTEGVDHGTVIAHFALMFAADNDRFDRDRFLAACKGQPINGRDMVCS
jgi:hypothetical protein